MGKHVDTTVQKLLTMWETGDLPKAVAKTMIARQAGDRPCDAWSLANQILMIVSGTEDARGFNQWQAVGRKVKKGAKAIYISGPLKKTITVKNEESGEEEKQTIIYGFKDIPVFSIENTEGEPISTTVPNYKPDTLPPLMDVAESWGIPVTYVPGGGNYYGKYMLGSDQIVLASHNPSTFFHELAHAAHSRIRPLKGGQDPIQEIVAETSAAVLCLMYGYEGYIAHARNYVAHYGKVKPEEATKAVMKALSDIEKVLEMILEQAKTLKARTA